MAKAFLKVLFVLFCTVTVQTTYAATSTAEKLQLLQSLTPEQQAMVLEKVGKQNGGVSTQVQPLQEPQLVIPGSMSPEEDRSEKELKARGEDTLIISFSVKSSDSDVPTSSDLSEKLLGSHVYKLDKYGVLDIPGISSIPLAGLNEQQIMARLMAEPDLSTFSVKATILPLVSTGIEGLKPFGYDLFSGTPTTFAPATDIPVPTDYVIGPGDTVQIQLFGNENQEYSLVVSRDGLLNFPGIGPVSVTGLKFSDMKKDLGQRIAEQMIGVKAGITMGPLRSIRVFVLGDARKPGSYTISALSTITNALFVSGGITKIGSLRDIQLKRNGKIVKHLDLYDLLLKGDTSGDTRLHPGDVIFIPPIGKTVSVAGEVRRPAIYELKKEKEAGEVVRMAGGLLPSAYPQATQVERINPASGRSLLDINLSSKQGSGFKVQGGDLIRVFSALEKMENIVLLSGHVERPGAQEWRKGMRLTDLIPSVRDLLPKADLNYVLVRRELGPMGKIKILAVNLEDALEHPDSDQNIVLENRDQVLVFGFGQNRKELIAKILDDLKLQSSNEQFSQQVGIGGRVHEPGIYPLQENMRVSDLIIAAGKLQEAAYVLDAELTRYEIVDNEYREAEHIKIDLASILAGNKDADILLKPYDHLTIRDLPRWSEQENVEILGEVRFPGKYPIKKGETLSSVLKRAGGVSKFAFVEGAVFMRESLRKKEQEQIDRLAQQLESDLAASALEQSQVDADKRQAITYGQTLVRQLRNTKAAGRLVIDLPRILANGASKQPVNEAGENDWDVVLKDKDKLVIPRKIQTVTVIGEVHQPTSLLYESGYSRSDYINRSGGTTYKADKKRIYVVRANGEVIASDSSFWSFEENTEIKPGDTIVVPLDAERMRPLTVWTSVTQIMYQIGVAVAAFNSAGIF